MKYSIITYFSLYELERCQTISIQLHSGGRICNHNVTFMTSAHHAVIQYKAQWRFQRFTQKHIHESNTHPKAQEALRETTVRYCQSEIYPPKTRIVSWCQKEGAGMQIRICNENKKRGRIHNSRCKLEIN